MRKWLARLSFSFMIFAVVFAWEAYHTRRGNRPERPAWAAYALGAGAALCFGLGLRGVRERHRMLDASRDDAGHDRDAVDGRD